MASKPKSKGNGGSNQERVNIKRISNGYLTVRSGLRDGKPFREERFSRQEPAVSSAPKPAAKPEPRRPAARSDAIGFVRG